MQRTIYKELLNWKDSDSRKPLMLYGARQVGKTYILKDFGQREFENMVYVNCYKNATMTTLFKGDVNIQRILLGLSSLTGEKIVPGKTLIFIDEVQEIPDVVAALKYFCEDARDIHIAVAGSLLGVLNMEGISFPTGKVDIMRMRPMSFTEFLRAGGDAAKSDLLQDLSQIELVNAMSSDYVDLLRQYYFVGGMPEAVSEFIKTKDLAEVRRIQVNILSAYEADIAKHAGRDTLKARMVFQSIPSQLAKENKKFIFGSLAKGSRSKEYESAIQWLVDAGLVYKVRRLTKVALPLSFYYSQEGFKLYLLDVGLLGAMAQVAPSLMLIGNDVFKEYKGAFTENYALTQLLTNKNCVVGYYSKDNSTMELDFVAQCGEHLLPIEVKAEQNVKSKSLRNFITVDNAGSDIHGYRFSLMDYLKQDWMTNIPLFAIESFVNNL
jgi:hypothetical protein